MTSRVHEFDPREGGRFRVSLTYDDAAASGKSGGHTDTYHGHFLRLVPAALVIESIESGTDDLAMQGEMRVTYELSPVDGGTELHALHEGLPPGLSPEDNETGWRLALDQLAALAEAQPA